MQERKGKHMKILGKERKLQERKGKGNTGKYRKGKDNTGKEGQ